jgi:hypothetical protein
MRLVLSPSLVSAAVVAFTALGAFAACSSTSASSTAYDAGEGTGGDDGSTTGCTSLGGTCESYAAGCPVLQQNSELCGNVVLVCCLPPGGAIIVTPDSGEQTDANATDASMMSTPPEAGSIDAVAPPREASPPPVEAGHPTEDAAPPIDAQTD